MSLEETLERLNQEKLAAEAAVAARLQQVKSSERKLTEGLYDTVKMVISQSHYRQAFHLNEDKHGFQEPEGRFELLGSKPNQRLERQFGS